MIENNTRPVVVNKKFEKHLIALGRKYVNMYKNGVPIMLTKVDVILDELLKDKSSTVGGNYLS